jgi:RNA polymerase sigma factor (sigma-70 family)
MTDAELIEGCSKGSRNHQRALYERYSALMMGVCMRYAANEEEAEDILQDGFVTVFGKINTFAGRGELGAWMRKVFLNTALMAYRKNKARLLQTDVDTLSYSLDSGEDLFAKVAAQDLMYMIQQLPTGARVIFNLYAVEGHEHHEIAEQLGISVGTSKSQYSRARQLLREMIELEAQRVHGSTIRK